MTDSDVDRIAKRVVEMLDERKPSAKRIKELEERLAAMRELLEEEHN
jgi:hypothetical protein